MRLPCIVSMLFLLLFLTEARFFTASRENQLLAQMGVRRTRFNLNDARNGRLLLTNLDHLRGLMVIVRHLSLWDAANNMQAMLQRLTAQGKMQRRIPYGEPFPCDLNNTRSDSTPVSVHRLRPGDIDIVASIGDSLSAGNGIMSESIMHIANEFRGVAFSGGGVSDWRTYLTLPNILKVFNPSLYGYSTEDGLVVDKTSRFNIAEPMIVSADLPFQVRVLIDRMQRDPHVDMRRHWKLLTIFLGNNDFCSDMCHHDSVRHFLERHEVNLREAFTILRDNVPRIVVNLVPAPNMVTTLIPMSKLPFSCDAVHRVGCHCVFSELIDETMLQRISHNFDRWQHVEDYVARLPEFQTDDFVVLYQPYTANVTVPVLPNGGTDLRYFASDCFHFSQLGHASMANGLWNNMMQPWSRKQREFVPAFEHFECPTDEHPYIATLKNSNNNS